MTVSLITVGKNSGFIPLYNAQNGEHTSHATSTHQKTPDVGRSYRKISSCEAYFPALGRVHKARSVIKTHTCSCALKRR